MGDAVRAEGLRFGFYYSLMEWDRPHTAGLLTQGGPRGSHGTPPHPIEGPLDPLQIGATP